MAVLHHEIHIAAPPETVWAVLADLTAIRHYNPLVQSARYTSKNKSGIGASRRCELKPNGFQRPHRGARGCLGARQTAGHRIDG